MHTALILLKHRKLVAKRIPTKTPAEKEILIHSLTAGICGTDVQIFNGARNDKAKILGHEGLGKIIKVGKNLPDSLIGKEVIFNPVNPNDQNDILGHSKDGIFQQKILFPARAIESGSIIPFDAKVPSLCAPFTEPLATVIYGQFLVNQVCFPKSIVIVGSGSIGILHAIYAKLHNISKILLVCNSVTRAKWITNRNILKPEETLINSPNLPKKIISNTNGVGADAVYLCTPRISAKAELQKSLKYVNKNGCIDLVGGFSEGDSIAELPGIDLNNIRRSNVCGKSAKGTFATLIVHNNKRVWLTGHRGTSKKHLTDSLEILKKHHSVFSKVISHVVSLEAAPAAFKALSSKKKFLAGKECFKVIIDFTLQGKIINHFNPQFNRIY